VKNKAQNTPVFQNKHDLSPILKKQAERRELKKYWK